MQYREYTTHSRSAHTLSVYLSSLKASSKRLFYLLETRATLIEQIMASTNCDAEQGKVAGEQPKVQEVGDEQQNSATEEQPKIQEVGNEQQRPATEEQPKPDSQLPMPPPAKQRYDWYQTETHVIITILIKRAKPEDVKVDLTETTFSGTVKLPTGSDYSLELDLAHPIVPSKSITKVLSSKIEVKLKKEEGLRWNKLEGEDPLPQPVKPPNSSSEDNVHKYPTSAHVTRNWDKLAKDAEKEEEENAKGEQALNNLFQKIYESGSDETKKAMNKSFTESSGTVLSTNWGEVKRGRTEVKPPDGMEHRKWDSWES